LKISLNLLSTALRKEWVEVPAHPTKRELGIGRVKIQEIPGDQFDELYEAVSVTETEVKRLDDETPHNMKALRDAKRAMREARAALLEACVIDHDPSTFAAEVPTLDPSSREGEEIVAILLERGFALEEAQQALSTGLAKKAFKRAECAAFYERCQPDNWFAANLIRFIKRFHNCDTMTAERYWALNGAAPFPSPKEKTE